MIGDGPLMAEARQRVAAAAWQDQVTLTGWLKGDAVQGILAEGDILLMPSLSEGLPVAAVEALKHGLAILGSAIGGLRDVVDQECNGYLLPLGDSTLFAKKLGDLIESDSLLGAMKRASWEKALEFDIASIAAQYEKVLREAYVR
jgi:glycosyltransferase involved in cell wall biosynthesis